MKQITRNNWYIKDNDIKVSLLKFHVTISICKNNKNIYYSLKVIDGDRKELVFNFYTLEDAIAFTEDTISNCHDRSEIVSKYEDLFNKGAFANQLGIREEDKKTTKFILKEPDILNAIISYLGMSKEYEVSAKKELNYTDGNLSIGFYLIEKYDNIQRETRLTNSDLIAALNNYLKDTDYTLINFKYVGGIHRVGYYHDEDTPYFEGIELEVEEKQKKLKKRREQNN